MARGAFGAIVTREWSTNVNCQYCGELVRALSTNVPRLLLAVEHQHDGVCCEGSGIAYIGER